MVKGPCNRNDCDRRRVPGSSLVGFCAAHELIDRARSTIEEGLVEHDPVGLFGAEDGPGDLREMADRTLERVGGKITDSLVFDFALGVIDDIVASDEFAAAMKRREQQEANWEW